MNQSISLANYSMKRTIPDTMPVCACIRACEEGALAPTSESKSLDLLSVANAACGDARQRKRAFPFQEKLFFSSSSSISLKQTDFRFHVLASSNLRDPNSFAAKFRIAISVSAILLAAFLCSFRSTWNFSETTHYMRSVLQHIHMPKTAMACP